MTIPVHCAHDKIVAVSKLKPNPANPNRHPPEQIALLAKIIQTQGWRNPIVVSNRSGLMTKGHARLEAARRIGTNSLPVDFQDYSSEKEELADMIADNRIAELAEADRAMLRELAEHLDDGSFDMDLTGFDNLALEELMTAAPPEVGENDPNAEWKGMPEFFPDDSKPLRSLAIHFETAEAVQAFSKLMKQPISEKTRYIWHPEKKRRDQSVAVKIASES